jgi:hypothetical protein
LAVARGCRRLSEGGPDVAVIEGSSCQSHQSEAGLDAAATEDSQRESQLNAAAIQGATRESHRAKGGLGVATNQGATLRSHRHSEGGIDVASRQARDRQEQYLNAQQAYLESEVEKEFLSSFTSRQDDNDSSDLAPVEVTTPGLQLPANNNDMLMLISTSGSAGLQHRLRSLYRKFSDIFLPTVREHPAVHRLQKPNNATESRET